MMQFLKGLRLWGLWVVPLLVIAWFFATDPDGGLSTTLMLQNLSSGAIAVTFAYLARKVAAPYIKLEELVRDAREGKTSSAIVALGALIFWAAMLFVFAPRAHAQDVQTYVPAGARTYAPILAAEQRRAWPAHPTPAMLASLVEKESCITLKHSRCWNPAARLKTSREEGAGFGQITRAWRADGTLRFDALADVRRLDPGLAEWNWDNVYRRPDLQLRAIVAMNRDCYRRIAQLVRDDQARLQMCDAAYNGGWAGMQAERRACGQKAGCDPQQWFGHVEHTCLKSKTAWQGYGQSACEINRGHVLAVTVVRWPKYAPLMGQA